MILHGHHHGAHHSIGYVGGPRHKEKIPSRHSWSRHKILALGDAAAERSRNKISYATCGPMSSIRNALLSTRTERILSRGLIGPRGEPAPTITGWRIDREGYAAVPVLWNGTEGAPLELPLQRVLDAPENAARAWNPGM